MIDLFNKSNFFSKQRVIKINKCTGLSSALEIMATQSTDCKLYKEGIMKLRFQLQEGLAGGSSTTRTIFFPLVEEILQTPKSKCWKSQFLCHTVKDSV